MQGEFPFYKKQTIKTRLYKEQIKMLSSHSYLLYKTTPVIKITFFFAKEALRGKNKHTEFYLCRW